jgi:tRNA1(Val) A37 N6-methylase TrmN6
MALNPGLSVYVSFADSFLRISVEHNKVNKQTKCVGAGLLQVNNNRKRKVFAVILPCEPPFSAPLICHITAGML